MYMLFYIYEIEEKEASPYLTKYFKLSLGQKESAQ